MSSHIIKIAQILSKKEAQKGLCSTGMALVVIFNPEHVRLSNRQQIYSSLLVFGLAENAARSTSEDRKCCKQISCMSYFNMCQVKVI